MPDTTRIDLTSAQRGIWYGQKLEPDNATFQIALYVELRGPLDIGLMRQAISIGVAEAESLNVVFREDHDGPYQQHGPSRGQLHVTDLLDDLNDPAERARRLMGEDLATAHDLERGELLRAELFHIGPEHWIFYLRAHHLLVDGYSAMLVLRRFAQLYNELDARSAATSDSPFLPLADLVAEESEYRSSAHYRRDAEFWTQQLAGAEPASGLTGRPPKTAARLVTASAAIPQSLAERLEETAAAPALVLSAAAAYLHRMTGRREITLGLPVTARRTSLAKAVPSMMSKIQPVQLTVTPHTTVQQLVESTGEALRGVLVHQRLHFREVNPGVETIGPSINIFPAAQDIGFGAAHAELHVLSTGPVDDLSVIVHGLSPRLSRDDAGDPMSIQFEGNADLYTRRTLEDHLQRFLATFAQMGTATQTIGALALTGEQEERSILDRGAGRSQDLPHHTVVEEFTSHADRSPDSTAVVASDGTLTFSELDRRSTQLAGYLRERGAGPGQRIAVRVGRTTALPIAVLGVLKSGAAYVPLDPDYPSARVEAMVADSAPMLVLDSSSISGSDCFTAIRTDAPIIDLDSELVSVTVAARPTSAHWADCADSEDLAYVMFTSGSTGRPKGIGVEHRSLLNLLISHRESVFEPAVERLGRTLRVAHTAGVSFDASWDPLLWLFAGHELHLIDDLTRRDSEELTDYFAAHRIDSLETTPSFARVLLAGGAFDGAQHPSVVALGGEAVDSDLWRRLAELPGLHAFNFYGPAETTVNSLTARIESGSAPVLGGSVANSRHYVLDSRLVPVPDQAAGELYIAGLNLAHGYLDRPATTAERFIADPFVDDGSRMYRTGDVVRRTLGAGIEFLGRMDDQVKLRGYRVELSEVEHALQAEARVGSAAALLSTNQAGYDHLLAYVTGTGELDTAELRRSLRTRLPDYMVPSFIVQIDSIPLTVNGKLDRHSLPTPEAAGSDAPPRNREEEVCAAAFCEVLGLTRVGIDDDFFELGGHSLLATRLVSELRAQLGGAPSLREVFQYPTVRELAGRLAPEALMSAMGSQLRPRTRPETIPLSYAQRRLWFLNQLDVTSAAYNIPLALRLRGELDSAALRAALHDVVGRHESLRTMYPWESGQPEQMVVPADDVRIDLPVLETTEALVHHASDAEAARGFDVSRSLPLRALLLRLGPADHLLLVTLHHIAADGWSLAPLARDLSTAYSARLGNQESAFTPLPVQYVDFTLWQRDELGGEDDPNSPIVQQLRFWTAQLDGSPDELALPFDRARGTLPAGLTARAVPVEISAETHAGLRTLAADHSASLFMVLQAAFAALLSRLGAGDDIPIGTPVAGRTDAQLDELVGFFVNTLVLRTDTAGNPGPDDLVERVRALNLQAYAHQSAPFERIVEELSPPRREDRHPLFQVMLTLQNTARAQVEMPDIDVETASGQQAVGAKFDLLLDLAERPDEGPTGEAGAAGISGSLGFDPALFDESTVRTIAARFLRVVDQFAAGSADSLADLDVLGSAERAELDRESRREIGEIGETIIHALEETVAAHPDRPALSAGGTELSFGELGERIRVLGRALRHRGVRPGDRTAVALPRSVDAVAVPLAVLSIGAVAVPIDLSYPTRRIGLILGESAPRAVVTETAGLPAPAGTVVSPAELLAEGTGSAEDVDGADDEPSLPSGADCAYEMFTSGSTGTPKGVAVSHRGLANLLAHHQETVFARASTAADGPARVLHLAGLGFDAAWDPVLWLVAGASLHVVGDDLRRDAEAVVRYCAEHRIDVLETTPSYARQLLSSGLLEQGARPVGSPALTLLLGGEAVPDDLWRELADAEGVDAFNLYGPTEFTIDSVTSPVEGPDSRIGRPIRNVRARVLDEHLQDVPRGVIGELYLAGAGAAIGYVNRPAETAVRFVPDPSGSGERMYRTGDLVRRDAEGRLDFVARADDQVKIRGFRIELGEVESTLLSCPGVEQAAAVIDAPAGEQSARLVGYFAGSVDAEAVRAHAAGHLPDYMVPRPLIAVEQIPLTSHGKLDRAGLPAPAAAGRSSREARTPEERTMCRTFGEVLGADRVGPDDDFFELGGHSLLAVTLIGRIREVFETDVALRAVFEAPTPAGLLDRLGLSANRTETHESALLTAEPAPGGGPAITLGEWARSSEGVRPDRLPLSYAQARMRFLNQLDTAASDYNISLAVRLSGDLRPLSLADALSDVIGRHEILRTVYPESDGQPVQQILPAAAGHGLLTLQAPDSHSAMVAAMEQDTALGFDLATDLPLRATLFEDDGEWVLHLVLHHIASDGASLAPLVHDLSTAYAARRGAAPALQRELPVQYADFALWQRHVLESSPAEGAEQMALEDTVRVWQERLDGIPTELSLPVDRPRPHRARQAGGQHRFHIDAETARTLTGLAAQTRASLFMALHAALAGYLRRIGGGYDIVIGSPTAGRRDPALERLVGLFINTVPIRTGVSGDQGFRHLLTTARESVLDALERDDVPFELLVEGLNPPRELGRHPVFQTMLTLENSPPPELDLPGVDAVVEPETALADAKFDLSFTFRRPTADAGLDVVLAFNSSMFDAATIEDFCARFVCFVTGVVGAPDRPIADIAVLDDSEQQRFVDVLSGPEPDGEPSHVLEVFAETVRRQPDTTALVCEGSVLSFRELDAAADRLAQDLIEQGLRPGAVVSTLLPRSASTVVAALGVLRSGAVCNPIDASYPVARVSAILLDAAPEFVLTDVGGSAEISGDILHADAAPRVLELAPGTGAWAASPGPETAGDGFASSERRLPAPDLDRSAYATFTSGSTGRPKGVEVGHRALANLLASHRATLVPTPRSESEQIDVAHTAGVGFDASWDPLLWMIAGHRLHMVTADVQRDSQQLARFMHRARIGAWETTPSYLRLLCHETAFMRLLDESGEAGSPVTLALGGEALDTELWRWLEHHPGVRAFNLYGPTETTVDAFVAPVGGTAEAVLGTPVQHMRGYVLDERLGHAPPGSIGELYLAGRQLAHGYLGRRALSAERFVSDPYGSAGSRMYRTGDLVARHRDGRLTFHGRNDDQLQIRGFRVELTEVERALRAAPGVRGAVVRAFGQDAASTRLVGYVVPAAPTDQRSRFADDVRRHLRSAVPDYMVPAQVVVIDEVPLTPHGKVDDTALPEPSAADLGTRTAPRTPREGTVARIFAEVLSVPVVGVDESFFELGGHSFLAPPLITAVNDALGTELPVQSLFRSPSVEQLVREAARGVEESVSDSLRRVLPLRTSGTKAPLFALHPATGISWGFAAMLRGLDRERPLIGLQMPGLVPGDGDGLTATTLTELADDYIAQMRTVQPEGPYHLIGWSFGGMLAQRLAARLQESGDEVALLAVLDAFPAGQETNAEVGQGAQLWAAYLDAAGYTVDDEEAESLDDDRALEILRQHGNPLGNIPAETVSTMTRNFAVLASLIRQAPVERFDGDLVFFTATRDVPIGTPGAAAWRPHVTGRITETRVEARHSEMLSEGALEEILPVLEIHLGEGSEPQAE